MINVGTKTVIKVKANSTEEAIRHVTDLITDDHEMHHYCGAYGVFAELDQDAIGVSTLVSTEEDFQKLRAQEGENANRYLKRAEDESHPSIRGECFRLAGECLDYRELWSTERLAFDDTADSDGDTIYYIDTSRW